MIVQPAREHPQGELGRIGLKAFDIADAEPVGLFSEESLEVPFQLIHARFQPWIAPREDRLVEIDVSLVVLSLLTREAISILSQRLIANLVQYATQRLDKER